MYCLHRWSIEQPHGAASRLTTVAGMSIDTLPRSMTTTPTPEVSRPLLTRVWQGPAEQERWVRPALFGLLIATASLYLWGLGSSGWANSFYSAAAQAGSESWKALFFGSSDAAQLDHRRQAADVPVDHGAVGPRVRPELVGDPGAASPDGCRVGGSALLRRYDGRSARPARACSPAPSSP